jgi:hypothetical protein
MSDLFSGGKMRNFYVKRGDILALNTFDNPLHLALGDSAAGCVRAALAISPSISQAVMTIPDDLSHGPLDDGLARADYMRTCYRACDEAWEYDSVDTFAPWQALIERLDRDRYDTVVVWTGENVSEVTFLAMVCDRLAGRFERIVQVTVPGKHGRNYVAVHAPEELRALLESGRVLSDAERAALAQDFARIREETGLLRRWQDGQLIGIPMDYYDSLLLEACGTEWALAARIIGIAMGHCDAANSMSDLFFCTRLRALIAAGEIQADGPLSSIRYYSIRRTA